MTTIDAAAWESEKEPEAVATPGERRFPWGALGLVLLLLGYGAVLLYNFAPAISEPDANGYWAQGSLLVETGQTWFKSESNAQYIGMHWLLTPSGTFISRYPPGLAILIGGVYAVFGHEAAVLVNPILALIAVTGMYFLARRLMGPGWSLLAAAVLAFNPAFTTRALQNDSHMAVAACLVWGFYFLITWSQQQRLWQIFVAGIVLGCIATVRYPDAIMALAVLVFMLMHWRQRWFTLHFLAAAVGAAIPIVPLLIRNHHLLGAFWRTGYALTNEQTGFGWSYFAEKWADYIYNMNADAMGLTFGMGLLAMVWMICDARSRKLGVLLTLASVPMILLYMAYYWGPQSMGTMRFIVPIIPCFVLGSVWLMHSMTAHSPVAVRVAVPLAVGFVQLAWGGSLVMSQAGMGKHQKQVLAQVTDALDAVTSKGDVIVAQSQLLQHLDYVRHWKLADLSLVGGGRGGNFGRGMGPGGGGPGGGMGGRGGFGMGPGGEDANRPQPMQVEKNQLLRSKYQGPESRQTFANDVFAWAGDRKVYLVGAEEEIRQTAAFLPASTVEIVQNVKLPEEPAAEPGRGGRGGRGGGGRGGFGGGGGGGQGFGGPPGQGGPQGPGGPAGPGMGGQGPGGPGLGGPGGPQGGFGGRGGRGRGGMGGGGGGPMGNAFAGLSEIVIAEWKPSAR